MDKMSKQELIEYTQEERRTHQKKSKFQLGYRTAMKHVYDRAVHLNEPEKPAIPECVADMIKFRKNQGDSLVATLVNLGAFGDAQRWIRHGNNGDTFAKAWLFDYTIAPDKLYTVELPNDDGPFGIHYVLRKNASGNVVISKITSENWKSFSDCQLTEYQIKKKYDWLFKFAKEVTK